jgi:hypothetical protein
MFAHHEPASSEMFHGVARPHRLRDLAAVAVCLALIGGFVAHAAQPGPAVSHRATTFVATSVPAPCLDVIVQ